MITPMNSKTINLKERKLAQQDMSCMIPFKGYFRKGKTKQKVPKRMFTCDIFYLDCSSSTTLYIG